MNTARPDRRRLGRLALGAGLGAGLSAALGGCATGSDAGSAQSRELLARPPAGLPRTVHLADTPFFPQTELQCGPASLATLLQAIAMAGGLDKLADPNDIKLFRDRKDGTRETIPYDLELIREGEAADPVLATSDVVVVGKSGTRSTIKDISETLRDISIFGLFF